MTLYFIQYGITFAAFLAVLLKLRSTDTKKNFKSIVSLYRILHFYTNIKFIKLLQLTQYQITTHTRYSIYYIPDRVPSPITSTSTMASSVNTGPS